MDNKELPQEMTYAAVKYTRRFQERDYTEVEMAEDIGKELAQIAQSHYEPIIEAKDTTIKELQAKNEKLTGLLKVLANHYI